MVSNLTKFAAYIVLFASTTLPVAANSDAWCNDDIQVGWFFYCDPELREKKELKPQETPPKVEFKPAIIKPQAPKLETAQERLARFSKRVDEAKALAILEPSEANLVNYLSIQKEMIDRAENFQKTWSRVLYKTPDLDHNTKYPLTNTGVLDYQKQIQQKRSDKLYEVSQNHVLMIVTEGPDICYVCETQLDLVKNLIEQNELSLFVVSKDGYRYAAFPNAEVDQGNLEGMGLIDNPTPFFVILNPSSGEIKQIGHGLLTQDQILSRVLEVMEPKIIDVPDIAALDPSQTELQQE